MKKKKTRKAPVLKPAVQASTRPAADYSRLKQIAALLLVLLAAFFLHMIVFSGFEEVFAMQQEEFLKALNLKIGLLVLIIILMFCCLYLVNNLVRRKWLNLFLFSITWVLIIFYMAGIWVMARPPSQGNGNAFISRLWFKKHWHHNYYGFRDKFYTVQEIADRDIILHMGDSYVAGHGIRDTADRTTNILQTKFPEYFVINTGLNGTGTRTMMKIIRKFPHRPKLVILSHVTNDIEDELPAQDGYAKVYEESESKFSKFLYKHSRNSAFLDMIYHIFKTDAMNKKKKLVVTESYKWYHIDSIFEKHMNQVQAFADYVTDTLHSKLLLVTYPESYPKGLDSSDLLVNKKIINSLRPSENIRILNTTPIFKEIWRPARSVNILDGHPSVKVNRMVADSLQKLILEWKKEGL